MSLAFFEEFGSLYVCQVVEARLTTCYLQSVSLDPLFKILSSNWSNFGSLRIYLKTPFSSIHDSYCSEDEYTDLNLPSGCLSILTSMPGLQTDLSLPPGSLSTLAFITRNTRPRTYNSSNMPSYMFPISVSTRVKPESRNSPIIRGVLRDALSLKEKKKRRGYGRVFP